ELVAATAPSAFGVGSAPTPHQTLAPQVTQCGIDAPQPQADASRGVLADAFDDLQAIPGTIEGQQDGCPRAEGNPHRLIISRSGNNAQVVVTGGRSLRRVRFA